MKIKANSDANKIFGKCFRLKKKPSFKLLCTECPRRRSG
jgi:hypothetical protein